MYAHILLNKIYPSLFFLNYGKANLKEHLSAAASEGFELLVCSSSFDNVSQKIILKPLINSYFCFRLITLQNFVLRT